MEKIEKISSFTVNHDTLTEGIYISRIDGDVTTYDLRTRVPNGDDFMDNIAMHSVEHMIATFLRNGVIGDKIIYFGPMGCQTGFYLLVRDADNSEVLLALTEALRRTLSASEMFGQRREECGNYKNLSLEKAKIECERYLKILLSKENDFKYR